MKDAFNFGCIFVIARRIARLLYTIRKDKLLSYIGKLSLFFMTHMAYLQEFSEIGPFE